MFGLVPQPLFFRNRNVHGDEHFVDASTVHIDDLEIELFPGEALAGSGNAFEQIEDQSAERVVVVLVVKLLSLIHI